tara:strand:+ start:2271 stop:3359 length:1089 start_codon:yes stop_codon:yes gene_type:complete
MKRKIIQFLDEPDSTLGRTFTTFLLFLVYISIFHLVIDIRYPELISANKELFDFTQYFILGVFTIELCVRLICISNRWRYIKSFNGIIDLSSVVPGLIEIFILNFSVDLLWVRVFRILRFFRILKNFRYGETKGGITQVLTPYFTFAITLKGIMVAVEGQEWYPEFSNLNIVIGVVGFSLAILLGTKLQVINNRLYSIEDTVCRIIGAMRDMQNNKEVNAYINYWAKELESALFYTGHDKPEVIKQMRFKTDDLEEKLETAGINGPNTAGFHRDVAYLLHRTLASTPAAYEGFLRSVISCYTIVVIATVPGITGLFATFLLVYVLGGLFFLISDMDSPLDVGPNSLIYVNLDPLIQFNEKTR